MITLLKQHVSPVLDLLPCSNPGWPVRGRQRLPSLSRAQTDVDGREYVNPWPVIPKDALEHFRTAFAEANRVATERIVNVPNIRETSLDDALVDALIPFSPPRRLQSGAVVEMNIHNIGGLRRLYRWETADIAVLVFIYRGRQMVAQKIGMLQTKRLFPKNNDVLDDD